MSKQPCPSCGHTHAADWTVAISRFQGAVRAYRARYDESPVRSTRDAAEADMCQHKQGDKEARREA